MPDPVGLVYRSQPTCKNAPPALASLGVDRRSTPAALPPRSDRGGLWEPRSTTRRLAAARHSLGDRLKIIPAEKREGFVSRGHKGLAPPRGATLRG